MPALEKQALATTGADVRLLPDRRPLPGTNLTTPAAIWRLPPELLLHVFRMCALAERVLWDREGWIAVTHVCRQWRNIALDCSGLWSVIYPHFPPQRTREYLLRSKTASLDVIINTSPAKYETASAVFTALSRIRTLMILKPIGAEEWANFSPFLRSPAPMLEELILMGRRAHNSPEYIFGNQSPRLKRLWITHLSMPWGSSGCLRGLSELSLGSFPPEYQPPLPELLTVLRDCPELEVLRLKRAGPRVTAALPPTPPIDLPRLRWLDLNMSSSICGDLLGRLILPATVAVDFTCHAYPVHHAMPLLPPHVPASAAELALDVDMHIDHMAVRAFRPPSDAPGRKRDTVSLNLTWPPSTDAPLRAPFAALGTLLATSGLTHAVALALAVHVGWDAAVAPAAWRRLLAALPRLAVLRVQIVRFAPSASALAEEALAEALAEERRPGEVLCPALRTLVLNGAAFSLGQRGSHGG